MGGADCALPMVWARRNQQRVSAFVIYIDSKTWAGNIHPAQALRQDREEFVGNAKAVVVGMTSNGFTLADPERPRHAGRGWSRHQRAGLRRFRVEFRSWGENPRRVQIEIIGTAKIQADSALRFRAALMERSPKTRVGVRLSSVQTQKDDTTQPRQPLAFRKDPLAAV